MPTSLFSYTTSPEAPPTPAHAKNQKPCTVLHKELSNFAKFFRAFIRAHPQPVRFFADIARCANFEFLHKNAQEPLLPRANPPAGRWETYQDRLRAFTF